MDFRLSKDSKKKLVGPSVPCIIFFNREISVNMAEKNKMTCKKNSKQGKPAQ